LSRRQRVQLEDTATALALASPTPGHVVSATSVSFRHLALLAQIKTEDEDVWTSLATSHDIHEPTVELHDRLRRMRSWIASPHFPEEMRISVRQTPSEEALAGLEAELHQVINCLHEALSEHPWTNDGITSAFKATAESSSTGMRQVYRVCYAVFMGEERGPRLAPILANCDRTEMLELILDCSNVIERRHSPA